jgi:hypothetical protein
LGVIHEYPMSSLAGGLSREGDIDVFVETGTYVGNSVAWASANFRLVFTIELNSEYQAIAKERHAALTNVTFVLGDSATELAAICGQLSGPALFWLDAHAGGGSFGDKEICPLIEEIEIILRSRFDHCLIIDDARAFLAPPPPPFDYNLWPTLDQVVASVARHRANYHTVAINDALIVVPNRYRELVARFCAEIRPAI